MSHNCRPVTGTDLPDTLVEITKGDWILSRSAPSIVHLTGMSGTGKSSTLAILAERGWITVDTDIGPWQIPDRDGEPNWDEGRMSRLLDGADSPLAIAGTVRNQGRFRDQFGAVVLLTAPLATMLQRVTTRTTNPYGHTQEERDAIRDNTKTVEPLLRASADLVLDTSTIDPETVADRIEAFLLEENVTSCRAPEP